MEGGYVNQDLMTGGCVQRNDVSPRTLLKRKKTSFICRLVAGIVSNSANLQFRYKYAEVSLLFNLLYAMVVHLINEKFSRNDDAV